MSNLAFLDIETSINNRITIIGIYRPFIGTKQLVGSDNTAKNIMGLLDGVDRIFTYNGARFDLPYIKRHSALDLANLFEHTDLMYECWTNKLYGGLKKVEMMLGIHRDTEGLNGFDAIMLWESYLKGDKQSLELLLRYNREDVENLEIVAKKLRVV